jgi:hypothetical protein
MLNRGVIVCRAILHVEYTTEHAKWTQRSDGGGGTLVVDGSFASSMMLSDTVIMFSFPLDNMNSAGPSPDIYVTAESGGVKRIGVCEDEMDVGCTKPDVPSTERALMVSVQPVSRLTARTYVYTSVIYLKI